MVSSEKILSAARHNWWLNGLGFALSFVGSVVLVRVLPPHVYGQYFALLAVAAMATLVFEVGANSGLTRYLPEAAKQTRARHILSTDAAQPWLFVITRRTATIALPNLASIRHRLSFLFRGRMGTDNLPPERRPDRHHWLTIRPQIDRFIRANAPRHGFAVKAQIAESESGALRPIATLSLALGLHFGGLFSARSIYHLARAQKARVESRCESLAGELCTAASV